MELNWEVVEEICGGGGRVEGGVPLPHQGVFAFWWFKISNLVHTFGEFDDLQPLRMELKGEVVGK